MAPRSDYHLGLFLVTAAAVARSTSGLFTRHLTVDTPTILFWRGFFGALATPIAIAAIPATSGLGSFRQLGRHGIALITALDAPLGIALITALDAPLGIALITALDAPLAPLWVWLIFAETPGTATVIGGTVVFAAVIGHVRFGSR